ncbi:MAG: hypothetical protein WAW17_20235 [Rhodococcus sp. (in: high G+C Gram-positive bacteria)]|uniref:hypothetical protein n=1 Tax=Rhodococcus sp. TaxID=1831 RepID=UPI003BAFE1C9
MCKRNRHPAEVRRLGFAAAQKITKAAPPATKLQRRTYLVVAGHGYYQLLAALQLILALVGGFARRYEPRALRAAATGVTAVAETASHDVTPPSS